MKYVVRLLSSQSMIFVIHIIVGVDANVKFYIIIIHDAILDLSTPECASFPHTMRSSIPTAVP